MANASQSKLVSPGRATVRNPLCDISNAPPGRDDIIDLDRDVIPIDIENAVIPDSVSPSPFRHRSRIDLSKVCSSYLV
jgi:hypothetical protein